MLIKMFLSGVQIIIAFYSLLYVLILSHLEYTLYYRKMGMHIPAERMRILNPKKQKGSKLQFYCHIRCVSIVKVRTIYIED